MRKKSLHDVRQELLALHGIGAETADATLTYAFCMLSFVLDAYTRRFLERLGYAFEADDERRAFLTEGIEPSADMYRRTDCYRMASVTVLGERHKE